MNDKTILIVDDEKDLLEVLAKRLESEGYCVLTADNGRDGLRFANSNHPDLIILDVLMPEISGGSVGLTLQEDKQTQDIPLIFLSCTFSDQNPSQGPRFGEHIRIAKPYDFEELIIVIEGLLNKQPITG